MTPPVTAVNPASLLDAIADRWAVPTPEATQDESAASLAKGAVAVALLHVERALSGCGTWATAHTWVRGATRSEVDAADHAGLFYGAPAISFLLHTAQADGVERYGPALTTLDAHVTGIAHRRVDAALARIDRAELPEFAEYDLFYGLTGIGRLLLRTDPGSDALGRILDYLVRLTRPLYIDKTLFPGWWTSHDPDPLQPTPGGHANLGVAHGITGPMALLSHALRRGITVDGQTEAIAGIGAHLDTWQRDGERGPWWPRWLTREELRSGHVLQEGPGRPSWCYGTPGIARALQLAAIATGDTARQTRAEHALAVCVSDPAQLDRITDAGLCHGWAGLYQTIWRAAHDALTPEMGARLPHLADRLALHANTYTVQHPGLLVGAAGTALALHTMTSTTPPRTGWDSCLLTD